MILSYRDMINGSIEYVCIKGDSLVIRQITILISEIVVNFEVV